MSYMFILAGYTYTSIFRMCIIYALILCMLYFYNLICLLFICLVFTFHIFTSDMSSFYDHDLWSNMAQKMCRQMVRKRWPTNGPKNGPG